jgi:hypothetical protein
MVEDGKITDDERETYEAALKALAEINQAKSKLIAELEAELRALRARLEGESLN